MKSLSDYLEEIQTPKPKYISVEYSSETQTNMKEWCESNGFDLTTTFDDGTQSAEDFDFHSTLWYTTSSHTIPNQEQEIEPCQVTGTGIELFGENNDIPVLTVKSKDLEELRKTWGDQYDMQDAWPDYKPHISLSYARRDYSEDIQDLTLPDFDIIFDRVIVKDSK
jgi:hypothetical protein